MSDSCAQNKSYFLTQSPRRTRQFMWSEFKSNSRTTTVPVARLIMTKIMSKYLDIKLENGSSSICLLTPALSHGLGGDAIALFLLM